MLPDQFAIWRVGPPWLPKTKKPQGTKLGGGKGSISHYVTPVRAKRIILEVGGYITEAEVITNILNYSMCCSACKAHDSLLLNESCFQ